MIEPMSESKTPESDEIDFVTSPELWTGVRSSSSKDLAARIYRYLDYWHDCFDDPDWEDRITDDIAALISMSDPEADRLKRSAERVERLENELEWARAELGVNRCQR